MGHRTSSTETISRRAMIGAGAASVLVTPVLAQVLPEQMPQLAASTSGNQLLAIPVLIDGKGPFQFVVDTGADRSVVADDVVGQLGLEAGGPVTVEGIVRTVRADTAKIRKIAVGVVERSDLTVPVLPRSQLLADGYLGLDIFDGRRLTMDFKNNLISLAEPRPAQLIGWAPPSEIPVRVGGSAGHLRALNCVVDQVRTTAFIDTGAEISVGNSLLYGALSARDSGYVQQETIALTGVTGGFIEGRVTTLRNVNLAGLTFEHSRVAIADLQIFRLWEIADKPALLIGMNWLRQFSKVSIDYGRKELRFDLANRGRQEPMRCNSPATSQEGCRYQLGSPNTMPRPSVPT